MSVQMLEHAARVLGPLTQEVMFVGGATVALWITDPGAPPPRPTLDVDVVVQVTTRLGYEQFTERMRKRGLSESAGSPVICRWNHAATCLVIDAMPADPSILGFANHWQAAALPHAADRTLPSGAEIRAATPPYRRGRRFESGRRLEGFSARVRRGTSLASS